MRIIIPNLHSNFMMLTTASVYVYKFSPAVKHGYLLRELLSRPDVEVCTYLTDRSFSLFTRGPQWLQRIFQKVCAPIEMRWIFRKNGIAGKVNLLRGPKDLRADDIILLYNICQDEFRGIDASTPGFKAVCMIHFGGNAHENAIIEGVGAKAYFNEADLTKTSEIFRRYYPYQAPWTVLPFVPAARFKQTKPFNERTNKAFSVGTITYKTHPEFIDTYGDPCDQPIRKAVKDNPEYFADTADSYSEDYLERGDMLEIKAGDILPVRLYKRIRNRFTAGRQKKYFSFDMVEKFNEYKMHIVGEEILGIPGIGYVEGMACGSAYIGIDSPMYRDLGLIPGEHYIAYDGTKEGLRATIEHWQHPENQAALQAIAARGRDFVLANFNAEKVADRLLTSLMHRS